MDNISRLAFNDMAGRYAWPLPVGCGKTQSACHGVASMLKATFWKERRHRMQPGSTPRTKWHPHTGSRSAHRSVRCSERWSDTTRRPDVTGKLVFDGSENFLCCW